MDNLVLDGATAWQNSIRAGESHWYRRASGARAKETARERIATGFAEASIAPKFALRSSDRFFCIGSCFARNIEEHLHYRELDVLSTSIAVPLAELRGRQNRFINKFTTASMLNELRWAFGIEDFPESSFVEDEGGWSDLQLAAAVRPALRERVVERRRDVGRYFQKLREATAVIVTLGLIEAWRDRSTGVFLNTPPSYWTTKRHPGRFEFVQTGYAENLAALEAIRNLLVEHAASPNIVVTVSPVPLKGTFTGQDVLLANAYSKSVLRVAAGDFAARHADVQYFPSYEMATTSPRSAVFQSGDERHVLDGAVDRIVAAFLRAYGIDAERPHPEFDEREYRRANPEIDERLRRGEWPSGYRHWLAHGRAQGLPLRPGADGPAEPLAAADMRVTIGTELPATLTARQNVTVPATIVNRGGARYATGGAFPVHVCYRWYDADGNVTDVGKSRHTRLPRGIGPGESLDADITVHVPQSPGRYTLALTLLQENVAWFDDVDPSNGVRASVEVTAK